MPNWIINEVVVTGERESIDKVAALIADEGMVNFNLALPQPEKFISHPNSDYLGYPNSNVWALENWGTKWNAQDSGKIKTSVTGASSGWYFSSAWSAPDLWFAKLVDLINADDTINVSITLDSADASDWSGEHLWRDGSGRVARAPMSRSAVSAFLGESYE